MAKVTTPARRILLVEDDLDQAHLIKFLLEAGGKYVVTLAQDGLRGTLLVRDTVWDLIITDLNLPGADGMEVVVTARTHQPRTPVLATTGYSGPQYADEALRKGATDVLIKPLERDELLARVNTLVGLAAGAAATDGAATGSAPTPVAKSSPAPAAGAPAVKATSTAPAPKASAAAPAAPPKAPERAAAPRASAAAPAAPSPVAPRPPAAPGPPPGAPVGRAAPSAPVGEAAALEGLAPESAPPAEDPTPASDRPLRVLAVSVRPGDAEAGCGATLLRHRDRGDRVIVLTLTHGTAENASVGNRDRAKAAGRAMGVRFFVGNAGSGDQSVPEDVKRLVKGALVEIRPDLVYVPSLHHGDANLRVAHETVANDVAGMFAIYAYDPGDAGLDFRPTAFVRVDGTLGQKLAVIGHFDPASGDHLVPARSEIVARYWARFGGGEPVEPLEVVRGEAPPWLGDTSLLP